MILHFQDINTSEAIKKAVNHLLEEDASTNGNINVEYVSEDEKDYYAGDDEEFIKKHELDDIYLVSQCVAGCWNQPLTLVAVEEY